MIKAHTDRELEARRAHLLKVMADAQEELVWLEEMLRKGGGK